MHLSASNCCCCVCCYCPADVLLWVQVRRAMAEQLYLQMLAVQSDTDAAADDSTEAAAQEQQQGAGDGFTTLQELPAESLEAALDVLLMSAWDGPLDQVRVSREELAAALQLEIKTRRVAKAVPAAGAAGVQSVEQESYQSLLDDAARGGGY